jgi:DNA-binding transcriptional LysR family regulator
VSLDQLRYFVTVADEGTMRGAARRLHISQPPLTRHIRALEDELGVALFARTARGMHLLPPGAVLLERARTILAALEEAVAATRGARPPPQRCCARVSSSSSCRS